MGVKAERIAAKQFVFDKVDYRQGGQTCATCRHYTEPERRWGQNKDSFGYCSKVALPQSMKNKTRIQVQVRKDGVCNMHTTYKFKNNARVDSENKTEVDTFCYNGSEEARKQITKALFDPKHFTPVDIVRLRQAEGHPIEEIKDDAAQFLKTFRATVARRQREYDILKTELSILNKEIEAAKKEIGKAVKKAEAEAVESIRKATKELGNTASKDANIKALEKQVAASEIADGMRDELEVSSAKFLKISDFAWVEVETMK